MNFFRGGDYQRRPGPYAHMHWAVCGQRARPAEAALARAGWTGVYRIRVILRGTEGLTVERPASCVPLPVPAARRAAFVSSVVRLL